MLCMPPICSCNGKQVFADKVIVPAANSIDWTPFTPLLERIAAAIAHYQTHMTAQAAKSAA
jgi:hypothetical protein